MFYKQTVDNIEVIVLSLDGGLLDLNRLRYNYFKRICKIHNYTLTKEQFDKSLGNMYTMYNDFPISKDILANELNELIERDLFEYAKLKPNTLIKEGTEELLQFFKQKNIKIAVISTHKIKRAIQYLQLTRLYDHVDFIIGGDSNNPPLPDPYLLITISEQLNVAQKNILVVANYPNLLYAANKKLMNVIYLTDLSPATQSISSRVFKVAKNNLEVINVYLFDRYDSMEMYSPLLGMSSDMSIETLEQTYYKLLEEYHNDKQLIELVRDTYHYFLGEILEKKPGMIDPLLFEDEVDLIHESDLTDTSNTIDDEQTLTKHFEFSDEAKKSQQLTSKGVVGGNPERINELMDIINGSPMENVETEETSEELIQDEKEHTTGIVNFLYTVVTVSICSFAGLIIFVAFKDFIYSPGIVTGIIKKIIDLYIIIVLAIYSFIFNSLHSLVEGIPDYNSLIAGNSFLSSLAIKLVLFIIFNLLIVYVAKLGIRFFKEAEGRDEFITED